MSAKDKAFNKSLILTEQRIAELARQRELDQTESLPVTYQGHDAATGTAKFSRGGDCCECNIISGGETITTGAIAIGETVLSRPTEGNIRLDRKPSIANPTECGSGGSPSPRTFGGDGGGGGGKVVPEPGYTCPAKGTIKAGSRRTVGLAERYEIYTGEKKSGVKIGGAPKELWEVCQTETVTIPNSPNAFNPKSPYSGRDGDDGCVDPAKPPKRCQWYDVTEEQALNLTGAPEGMFVSGYVEYPEGTFRVLACMEEDEPANDEGTGFDWNPANVLSSGTATQNTNYCSGIYQGQLIWSLGDHTTSNPPISYQLATKALLIGDQVIQFPKEILNWDLSSTPDQIEVNWGGGDIEIIAGSSSTTSNIKGLWSVRGRVSWNLSGGGSGSINRNFMVESFNPVATSGIVIVRANTLASYYVESSGTNLSCYLVPSSILTPASTNFNAYLPIDADGATLYGRLVGNPSGDSLTASMTGLTIQECQPSKIRVASNTGAFSERSTTISPTITLLSGGCSLQVNYIDGTSSGATNYPVCPTVSAVQNTVKISDSGGLAATYEYGSEPTNFRYACRSNTPNC